MYRVSFTGYRPQKLPFFGEDDPMCVDLKDRIYSKVQSLYESGAEEYYTGMALGTDIWCAEAVLRLQELHPEIKLFAVVPCLGQENSWSAEDQKRYHDILDRCEKVIHISEKYTKDCMHKRNKALVDLCDVLVAVYDGKTGGTKFTVDYAAKVGRKTIIIPPM